MAKAKKTPRKTAKKKASAAKRGARKRSSVAKKKSSKKATRSGSGSTKAKSAAKAKPKPEPKPRKVKVPAGTRERLEEERQDLEGQLNDLDRRRSERETNGGYGDELADAETETIERERELSLAENLRDLLDQVEHALSRIDEGSYGVCESCGKRIEAARLRALPYASLCIECKRREERRG